MRKFHEGSEAKVHVIGIGEFGTKVVGKIAGHHPEGPLMAIVTRPMSGQGNQSFQPVYGADTAMIRHHLNEIINDIDLAYIVTSGDEANGLLEIVFGFTKDKGVATYLIVPETAVQSAQSTTTSTFQRADGGFIVSESSMSPPYLYQPDKMSGGSVIEYLTWLLIEQLYRSLAGFSHVAVDYADFQAVARGAWLRVGIGIGSGQNRALVALQKAQVRLAEQGVELGNTGRIWCIVNGSSESLTASDYVQVSNSLHSGIAEECIIRVVDAYENSLVDKVMVAVFAGTVKHTELPTELGK